MSANFTKIYKAAIFDMDGLLVDSERLSFECWQEVSKERGYNLTQSIFSSIVGLTGAESHRVLREQMGADFPAEELRAKKTELFELRIDNQGAPLLPGALELLELLQQYEVPVAVATSTEIKAATKRLEAVSVMTRFPVIVTGNEVTHKKPAPDLYLRAAELLNRDPLFCLALEDSSVGVTAAKAAGMDVVMVPNMKSATPRDYENATFVCDSLYEVLRSLRVLYEK